MSPTTTKTTIVISNTAHRMADVPAAVADVILAALSREDTPRHPTFVALPSVVQPGAEVFTIPVRLIRQYDIHTDDYITRVEVCIEDS